jgi:CRP/FNR family cyclic AMP-dependent transcriptional regulator
MVDSPSVAELLARSELFGSLGPQRRVAIAREMREVALDAGQTLFARGDPGDEIYIVLEGRIRLSVLSPDGRELSFAHAVAGDVFGEIAALDGAPRSADATALTPSRLKTLSRAALLQLLKTDAGAALAIIRLLCSRLRDVSEHFEAIALHPTEVRLARLLLDTLQARAKGAADKVTALSLGISQSELALLMGSTRQRANAALTVLERAGAIRRDGNRLHCNLEGLRRIAQRG